MPAPRKLARSVVLALLAPAALAAQGPPAAGRALAARLDSIARQSLADEPLAGLSVAVLRGRDTLLLAGYGVADASLGVPVTPATTFRLAGPATLMLSAALMQQVEAGRLRLDDDAARLLPEFPWQGRHVTVRQLMDATSGLVDFHYLGDALVAKRAVPKAWDEVTALFAGLPFGHEPGARWVWTVSGFHLAGGLLERSTGMRYADYLRDRIVPRAGLTRTFYCDDRSVTPGLAHPYEATRDGFRNPPLESASLYPYHASVCSSARDVAALARALRDGRLVAAASWRAMTTAEGAAATARTTPADSTQSYGFGVRMNLEDGHRWVGDGGSLMGFSSSVMDFPEDALTVAVVSNTGSGAATRVARQLARAALGLAPLPRSPRRAPEQAPTVAPAAAAEGARYVGTYLTRPAFQSARLTQSQRTVRVFDDNGRLSVQPLGERPEALIPTGTHAFTIASQPALTYVFTVDGDRATALTVRVGGNTQTAGPRVPNSP